MPANTGVCRPPACTCWNSAIDLVTTRRVRQAAKSAEMVDAQVVVAGQPFQRVHSGADKLKDAASTRDQTKRRLSGETENGQASGGAPGQEAES